MFSPPVHTHEDEIPVRNRAEQEWFPITDNEIQQAIFTSAPRKAPGPDGITFLCLQHAYTAIPQHFNMLFRALLEIGYHPKCWREGTGAILPKANKPDYKLPKAYRIITLLNCLGKIAEKLVAKRLAYLCEVYNLLHPEQLGGRQQ